MTRGNGKPLTPAQTLFMGTFFLLIGLAIAFFGVVDTKLSCSKSPSLGVTNLCTIERTNLWIFKRVESINLSDLTGAQVESKYNKVVSKYNSGRNSSTTYNTVLLTKTGKIPLTLSRFTNRSALDNDCLKINQFISSPEGKLEIEYTGLLIVKLFGLFLAWAGIQFIRHKNGTTEKQATPVTKFVWVMILLAVGLSILYYLDYNTKLSCSRSLNLCTIEKANIFGIKNAQNINLSDLIRAEVKSRYNSGTNNSTAYKVVLITKNGEIVLTPDSIATQVGFISYTSADSSEINQYIQSEYERLEKNYSSMVMRILGLIFVGLGVLVLFTKPEDITVY